MNGLDWLLVAWIGVAAVRGFFRGFVVEICALVGWLLGIWAAVHLSDRVGAWVGLEADQQALAFGLTFLLVLVGVHLLARAITAALDLAQLSLPNKAMGVVFGAVRSAFVLSVLLNVLDAAPVAGVNERMKKASNGSALYGPVRGFAPMIVPALGKTKWVRRVIDDVKKEGGQLMDR